MKLVLSTQDLMEASDYRGFLSILYQTNKKISAQFSYAYIAKQCQFSSKSFIKEVIDGKKSLTFESVNKIIEGLPLPGLWGKYFFYLVVNDEKLPVSGATIATKELSRLRTRLSEKPTKTLEGGDGSKLFQMMQWPHVYAALGCEDKGASFLDVQNRTGLSVEILESTLAQLIVEKMVRKQGRRYFAITDSAFFEGLGRSQFFKNFYTQSVGNLFDRARKEFNSDQSLFYAMSLSINPAKMPLFKKDLAELLDRYTSKVEEAQGTRVAALTCGFHLV